MPHTFDFNSKAGAGNARVIGLNNYMKHNGTAWNKSRTPNVEARVVETKEKSPENLAILFTDLILLEFAFF